MASSTRTKENCPPKSKSKIPVMSKQKSKKVKPVPNFSKLHDEWNRKFEMGKACRKKCLTMVNEFDLTRPDTKFSLAKVTENKENAMFFTPNSKSLHSIVSDTGLTNSMTTGRATIATSRSHTPLKDRCAFSELSCDDSPSKKPKVASRLAEEQQKNGIGFETDRSALKSIICDEGIRTPLEAGRPTGAQSCFTSLQQAPRNSIYSQGPSRMSLYESLTRHRNVKSRLGAQLSDVSEGKREGAQHSDMVQQQTSSSASSESFTDRHRKELIQQNSTQPHSEQGCSTPKSPQSVRYRESSYVKGPVLEPMRQSLYVTVAHRAIITPSPAAQRPLTSSRSKPMLARRVLKSNSKHMTPNNKYSREESSSVKKIRKTLRWADILESPSTFKSPKEEPTEPLEDLSVLAANVAAAASSSVDGAGLSASVGEISERRPHGESSEPALSHPASSSRPSSAQLEAACHSAEHSTPEETATAAESRHVEHPLSSQHPPDTDDTDTRHDVTRDTQCHSNDRYTSQLKVLDEQKRKIQSEMLQLEVAMEEERRGGQVDNHHHHHQSAHHSINHLPHHTITPSSHLPHHPQNPLESCPVNPLEHHPVDPLESHPAADNLLPQMSSSHLAMQALPTLASCTIPQPNFDIPTDIASVSGWGNNEESIDASSNVHLTIMQQLEAARRRQELATIRHRLEHQLRLCSIQEQGLHQTDNSPHVSSGQAVPGHPAGVSLVPVTAECNNNDLKDNTSCIPTQCPPPCRQEHVSVDAGDINDNYCSSSITRTAATSDLDSQMDVDHAGHDTKTEHSLVKTENCHADEPASSVLEVPGLLSEDLGGSRQQFKRRNSLFELVVPGQSKSLYQKQNVQEDFYPSNVKVKQEKTTDFGDQLSESTPPSVEPFSSTESAVLTPDIFSFKQPANIVLPTPQKPESREMETCKVGKEVPPIWTPLALKVAAGLMASHTTSDECTGVATEHSPNNACDELVNITGQLSSHLTTDHKTDLSERQQTLNKGMNMNNSSDVSVLDVIPPATPQEPCKVGSLSLRANLKSGSRCQIPVRTPMFGCSLYMDALLDDEVAFFSCRLRTYFCDPDQDRDCPDPVAVTLSEGDDMHFVPISRDGTHNGPLTGSAFSLY